MAVARVFTDDCAVLGLGKSIVVGLPWARLGLLDQQLV